MSVFDDLMRHKIFLQRLGVGEANKIYKEIVKLTKRLDKILKSQQDIKIRELNKLTNDLRDKLSTLVIPRAIKDLNDLAKYENDFNLRLLRRVEDLKGRLKSPPDKILNEILTLKAMKYSKDGNKYTVEQGYKLLSATVASDLNKTVRNAQTMEKIIENSENLISKEIVKTTKGLLFRRASVVGVTVVNHISSQVLRAIYSENDNIIEKLRWDTMLDQYVCEDCEALEGREWEIDEVSEEPPLHANCRCVLAPVSVYERNSDQTTQLV